MRKFSTISKLLLLKTAIALVGMFFCVPMQAQAVEPTTIIVEPLLKTAWGQTTANNNPTGTRYVYNYYTPNHYPCGCVATAMAQVMAYHQWTKNVEAKTIDCRVGGNTSALMLKGGTYDWANMPDKPFDIQYALTDVQKQAIGKLCFDASVSLGSSFNSSATSASTANSASAFKDVFGYKSANVYTFDKEPDFFDLYPYVIEDLEKQRPVIAGIGTIGETGGGHSVVIDGYGTDANGSYILHLNVGFCGNDNGWYYPDELSFEKSGTSYAAIRQVVYNIVPGEDATVLTATDGNSLKKALDAANVSKTDVTIRLSGTITANSIIAFSNANSDVTITVEGPATIMGFQAAAISTNKAKIIFRNVTVEKGVSGNITVITDEVPDATEFSEEAVICASGQRQVYFGWPTMKGVTSVKAQVLVDKEWIEFADKDIITRSPTSAEPTIEGWKSIRYIAATPGETAFYRLVAKTEKGTTFESEAVQVTTAAAGKLHSRSGAKATIYLDFDGYVDDYAGNASAARAKYIQTPVFEKRDEIAKIWRSVAEDFSVFDVDVTTEEPPLDKLVKSDAKDEEYGKRVVFDKRVGLEKWYIGAGGVSGLGAFGFRTDRPAFIFGETTDNIACQATHEVSHTLGLVHDGGEILIPAGSELYENGVWTKYEKDDYIKSEYFSGQRVSLNCTWYPVMGGVPTADGGDYINQFSNGNYETATNTEDDFAVITGKAQGVREGNVVVFPKALYPDEKEEGFWKLNLLPDDVGNDIANAAAYTGTVPGLISPSDIDVFSFEAGKGKATIKVSPEYQGSSYGCSLDAKVELLDAKGNVLKASIDPLQGNIDDGEFRKAELEFEIASEGTYFVRVSGTFHETRASMTTAYGSVGPYVLTIDAPKTTGTDPGAEATTVAPFMSEHWSQTKPYNNLVPAYLPPETGDTGYEAWGGHVTAGCVATAMAQAMHYWEWPRHFDSKVEVEHSVSLDKGKTQFGVGHAVAKGVPIVYDESDDCKARLTFIAATLGHLTFDRDGTGGYPSTVANALSDYYVAPPTCDDVDLRNYLKLGYPVPATITGHAIVLNGWKRDDKGNEYYYMNNGGVGADGWIDRATIKSLTPFFPKKMVMIKPIPSKAKLPLTVEWSFPEAYLKIYPTAFQGFTLKAIPSSSKGTAEVEETLGRGERSFTFNTLKAGETYSIEITPRFGALPDGDPTVFIAPVMASVMTAIDNSAAEAPTLNAPKTYSAALTGGGFKLTGSKDIASIAVTTSLKSYTIDKTTYNLADYVSIEGKEGEFTVKLKAIDFLSKSDNYNVVFTFAGETRDGTVAYAETIVNFSAANKGEEGTDPGEGGEEGGDGGEGSGGEGTDPGTEPGTDPTKQPDYILISPSDFVSEWTGYVEKRKIAHPKLTFAVKNAADIYKDYNGDSPSQKIKAYIVEQAGKGTKYFVLGGAWSDISSMDGKSEESFVVPGENGDKYASLALSLDNTIPGFTRTFGGKTLATDYPYALVDGDEKPDVVVARIPLVPWPKADGSVASFGAMIEGYGQKVAAVEGGNFSGSHRYACAGAQLGTTVARGSEYWPTERHHYADGYYDFFDSRHPDSATDGMIAARRRFRDFFAMYNPVKGAMVIPLGNAATDFFDDKSGWEAIVAKSHGLEGEAYETGITDARFRETSTLVKFGIFAMPCLTGRPDRTTTWGGWSNLRYPSMGVAAICNPTGGEVVGFHNTHDGAGENKVELVTTNRDAYATQYEGFLLTRLCKEHKNAGLAWKAAHEDYIDKHGTGTWHLWTAYESLLYGDPLVEMSAVNEPVCGSGKLPAKVLFK